MRLHLLFIILLCVFFFDAAHCVSQNISVNKYGLEVVSKKKVYIAEVQHDSTKHLIELKSLMPNVVYDLKYATTDNFTHQKIYSQATVTFLRLPAAQALAAAQRELNEEGVGLKIWDAYRPYTVTEKFWQLVPDERYAANPATGSGHNRGIAVDVTLIDLKTGKELLMPTGFDNFSDTAHCAFMNLTTDIINHRALLISTMEKHGFKVLESEWWHFAMPDAERFELLDLDFSDVLKAEEKLK